jgi:hypothetical protein
MRATPLLLTAFSLIAIAPRLAAQSDWLEQCRRNHWGNDRAGHCEVRESRVAAQRSLVIEPGENGGVSVEGWNESGMLVRAKIQAWAPSESEAAEIARHVRIETGSTLRAIGPEQGGRRGWAVNWEVMVPRRTGLDVATRNGPISVENVSGQISLRAQNGPISLRGVSGDVRGRAQNGPISVVLEGSRWTGTGLDVETVNGPVSLRIPRDYSAELETGTVNGPMNLDLDQPILVRGRITRRIQTRLGEGGAPVRVITTNGPVTLRNS